jgi:hypothetical protein
LQDHEVDVKEVAAVPLELKPNAVNAPDWLRSFVPTVRRLFGAQHEGEAGAPGPEVANEPRPVVMACPNCSASLSISTGNERTTTCQYCKTDIYLPDDLWRRLHPVKKAERWYIEYEGESPAARSYRLDEERKHAENQARDQEEHQRANVRTIQILEQRRRSLRGGVPVMFALLVCFCAPALNYCAFKNWGGETGAYKWPGAGLICPRVCPTCKGPFKPRLEFSRTNEPNVPYCRSTSGFVEVPFGLYVLAGTLPGLLLGLFIFVVVVFAHRIKTWAERAKLDRRIADLRRNMP